MTWHNVTGNLRITDPNNKSPVRDVPKTDEPSIPSVLQSQRNAKSRESETVGVFGKVAAHCSSEVGAADDSASLNHTES